MHRTLATIAILAAVFAATTLHAATITIPCSADTAITSANEYANLGGKTNIPIGVSSTGYKSRGLFRFDLTNISPDATIVSAALNFHVTLVPSDGVPSTFELHRMYVQWNEGNKIGGDYGGTADPGEATWRMRTTIGWFTPGGLAGLGQGNGDYILFDAASAAITNTGIVTFTSEVLAQEVANFLRNSGGNNGWMIHETAEFNRNTEKRFGTREDPANAPTLVVTYTTPGEPPEITTIFKDGTNIVIVWIGGFPAYQIQSTDNPNGEWTNLGPITTNTSALIPTSSTHQFFRIVGHQTAP
jgi:hypothetical protein